MLKKSMCVAAAVVAAGSFATVSGGTTAVAAPSKPNKTYVADLQPLNAGVNGLTADGTARITLTGDRVDVDIDVSGVNPGTLHPQHIHAGPRCATQDDDANGDGFMDVIEGLPDYGPILINLDNTFANPTDATLGFPVADGNGTYSYDATGSKSHFQDELEVALKLGTRHVVIHGVDPATSLPASVQSLPGLPAWATLPVACGELVQTR